LVDESEFAKKFRQDVDWIHANIPPDDIYVFAHQSFLAAEYFLWRWSQWESIVEDAQKNEMTNLWVQNIIGIKVLRDKGAPLDYRD
jgi:hypothetical protein